MLFSGSGQLCFFSLRNLALCLGPITFQSLHSEVSLTPHPNPHSLIISSLPPIHLLTRFTWIPSTPILCLFNPSQIKSTPFHQSFPILPSTHKSNTPHTSSLSLQIKNSPLFPSLLPHLFTLIIPPFTPSPLNLLPNVSPTPPSSFPSIIPSIVAL